MLKLLPKLNKQWINEMNPSIYLSMYSEYILLFFPCLFNVFESY